MITYNQLLHKYYPLFKEKELPLETLKVFLFELCNEENVDMFLELDNEVKENILNKFERGLPRLLEEEPLNYVLGYTHFFGYKILVNKDCLIPRYETEELVVEQCIIIQTAVLHVFLDDNLRPLSALVCPFARNYVVFLVAPAVYEPHGFLLVERRFVLDDKHILPIATVGSLDDKPVGQRVEINAVCRSMHLIELIEIFFSTKFLPDIVPDKILVSALQHQWVPVFTLIPLYFLSKTLGIVKI